MPGATSCDNYKLSCNDYIMNRLAKGKAGLCLLIGLIFNSNGTRGFDSSKIMRTTLDTRRMWRFGCCLS